MQECQLDQRESIDSPTNLGSTKRSRRKSLSITTKNLEHEIDTSNAQSILGIEISSSTPHYESCIGIYDTSIEYDMVLGEICRLDAQIFL